MDSNLIGEKHSETFGIQREVADFGSNANSEGSLSDNPFPPDACVKVTVELQENILNPPNVLTGMKMGTLEDTCISDNENHLIQEEDDPDDLVIEADKHNKKGKKTIPDKFPEKRTKSQRKCKTSARAKLRKNNGSHHTIGVKNNLKKQGKVHVHETDDYEVKDEDRFELSSEPEIKIHCKAKYIKLKPICKGDLDGKDLYIEVEIDKDLIVSPIEKYESSSGKKSKYTFKVSLSKNEDISGKRKFKQGTENMNNNYTGSEKKVKRTAVENSVRTDCKTKKKRSKLKRTVSLKQEGSLPASKDSLVDNDVKVETEQLENHGTNMKTEMSDTESIDWYRRGVMNSPGEEPNQNMQSEKEEGNELKIRKVSKKKEKTKTCKPKRKQTKTIDYSTRITEDGLKLFGCPVCNYESKYSQNIRSHYLIHMNVKPWICDVCGSAFVSKCNLRHHMISHSEDRPFKCSICGLGFKQKVVLQQHVARHNEERHFVCDHCGKGFCISGDLKKHIRTHTGEKPYTCEVCFKQFSDNSSLARHRYLHNEEKKFSCQKCDKRFARRDMCNSHMKTHCSGNESGTKTKRSTVKRTKKAEVGNVVDEAVKVEMENRDVAPREHLYHIENYAKEIQERTYSEMDVTRSFAVVNYPQPQQQPVQAYPQRNDANIQQENYPREYTAMWPNLHYY